MSALKHYMYLQKLQAVCSLRVFHDVLSSAGIGLPVYQVEPQVSSSCWNNEHKILSILYYIDGVLHRVCFSNEWWGDPSTIWIKGLQVSTFI